MGRLHWALLLLSALTSGASLSAALIVRRRHEAIALGTAIIALAIMAFAYVLVVEVPYEPMTLVVASGIVLAGFLCGFSFPAALPFRTARTALSPSTLPADHRVAVLLIADLEHDTYTPGPVAQRLRDLSASGLKAPGPITTPFLYASEKARYQSNGGSSPERAQAHALAERVTAFLDSDQFAPVLVVPCRNGTSLHSAVLAAIAAGHSDVVVVTPYAADPPAVQKEFRGALSALPELNSRLRIVHAEEGWMPDALIELVAARSLAMLASATESGVALVMHGQPEAEAHAHPSFETGTTTFVNRVRARLIAKGIPAERVRACWQEWGEPDVTDAVRHLEALGCRHIVVSLACFPFDNLVTAIDVPLAVRSARVAPDVRVVLTDPWGADDEFARLVASSITHATQ